MFANRNSCRALCGSIKNEQELYNFLNQKSMITLEKLVAELHPENVNLVTVKGGIRSWGWNHWLSVSDEAPTKELEDGDSASDAWESKSSGD